MQRVIRVEVLRGALLVGSQLDQQTSHSAHPVTLQGVLAGTDQTLTLRTDLTTDTPLSPDRLHGLLSSSRPSATRVGAVVKSISQEPPTNRRSVEPVGHNTRWM